MRVWEPHIHPSQAFHLAVVSRQSALTDFLPQPPECLLREKIKSLNKVRARKRSIRLNWVFWAAK